MKPGKYSFFVLIFISLIFIGSKFKFPQTNFISYDNFGYYLFLPASFIYHDPGLEREWYKEINEKYKSTPTYFQLMKSPKGGVIIRFFRGMSMLWLPAFFVGHFVALIGNFTPDGFSAPYQWALILYGAMFAILGLIMSRKILLHFFNDKVTAITLLLMFVGTNLFFFSTLGNDVPHVYLYTLYTFLVWFTIKWHKEYEWRYIFAIAISMGLIMSVRPSEVIVAAIPAFWGVVSIESLKSKIFLLWDRKWQVFIAIVIAFLFLIPQFLYYKSYAGEYFLNVYNDAGSTLNLMNPRFAYVLIGFRKGWFIYSPLSILALVGLYYCWKNHRDFFWPIVIFLFVNIYLIASFTSLVSYGWRAFIQSYAFLILPLGCFADALAKSRKVFKIIAFFVLLPFFILNIHQAWQVRTGVIDGSRMTKAYFLKIIGKNKVSEEDRSLLLVERSSTSRDSIIFKTGLKRNVLLDLSFEDSKVDKDSLTPQPFRGIGMFKMSKNVPFSPGLKLPYKHISSEYYFYLRASVWVYGFNDDVKEKLRLVVNTATPDGGNLKYRAFSFESARIPFLSGKWNRLSFDYLTPEVFTKEEIIQCYVWYEGSGVVWVDNLHVDSYTLD